MMRVPCWKFLALIVVLLLAGCGGTESTAPTNTPADPTDTPTPEVESVSEIAYNKWKGETEVEGSPNYEDYFELLIKRSKVKKDKSFEDSPREKNNGKKNKEILAQDSDLGSTDFMALQSTEPLLMTHYMPWFQSLDVSGYWGIHWAMNTCDPNVVDANGRREICSHHYPLIGPYDTSDPDLLEYHALLMHLSGIDGVIIDWYGTMDHFDWPIIRNATEKLIDALDKYDLKYVIMYEDKTIRVASHFNLISDGIAAGQADLDYLETNFFSRPNYLHINDQPLLLNFGPSYFESSSDWRQVFSDQQVEPYYQGLWAIDSLTNEFVSWIYNDVDFLPWFYDVSNREEWSLTIGEAYPMFDDYYLEGGWGNNLFEIDDLDGQRFSQTLQQAKNEGADIIQLNTWNDFNEGSEIEPSIENGYQYLVDLQEFTGVEFTQDSLEAATEYYFLRKQMASEGLSLSDSNYLPQLILGEVDTVNSALKQVLE